MQPVPQQKMDVRAAPVTHDESRSQQRAALIAEAWRLLDATLDYEQVLSGLAALSVSYLADYAIVDLAQSGAFSRASVAHADPDKRTLVERLAGFAPDPTKGVGVAAVLRQGSPLLTKEVNPDDLPRAARSPEHLEVLQALNPRSSLMLPLVFRGEPLGVLTLAFTDSGRRYTEDDLEVVAELARVASVAIQNALLLRKERRARLLADRLQAVTDALSAAMSLSEVAHSMVQQGCETLDALTGAIWLLSPDSAHLELIEQRGFSGNSAKEFQRVRLEEPSLTNDVVRTGEAIYIPTLAEYKARYPAVAERLRRYPIPEMAIAALPLMGGGACRGVLVFSFRDATGIEPDGRALLVGIAKQGSLALERAQLFADLDAQRRRLHDLLMQAPALTFILRGPDHLIELANPLFCRLVRKTDLAGKTVREALPEYIDQYLPLWNRVLQTGEPYLGREVATRIAQDNGVEEERFFNFVLSPVRDGSGAVVGIENFGFEVTEQVLARRRIEESEARYRHIFQNAGIAIFEVDLTGLMAALERLRLAGVSSLRAYCAEHPELIEQAASLIHRLNANEAALQLLGARSVDELLPRLSSTFVPQASDVFLGLLDALWERRTFFSSEAALRRMDGSRVDVVVTLTWPAPDQVQQVLATVVDISERKRTSEERERILEELSKAVRLRDEFLSVASHELKTPLTPLLLKLQALSREAQKQADSPFAQRVLRELELGRKQVAKLSELIGDLLDVSRISNGRLTLHPEEFDMAQLLREVTGRFEQEAQRAGSAFTLVAGEPSVGRWDRMRVEQVVTNLLSNAFKYGASKPVEISLEEAGPRTRIVVRDHGIGIAEDVLPRLFMKFERGVSGRNYGGLGLGLYVSKQIVEAMGGTISVTSKLNEGSVFTVELPR